MPNCNELSPVLNVTTGNLVELPLNNPIVIDHATLHKHKALGDILLINNSDYRKVLGLLNPDLDTDTALLDNRNLVLERAFFLDYTNKPMRDGYSTMSLAGREIVWDKLIAKNLNMKEIMRSTKSTAWFWYEATPADFLTSIKENINGMSDVSIYKKAVESIVNSWGMKLAASHKVANKDHIIIYLGDDLVA